MSPRELRGEPAHPVAITPTSRLAHIIGSREVPVTSTHHQIILDLAPDLAISAVAPDGVIEAVEVPPLPPRCSVAPRTNGSPPSRATRPVPISRRVDAAPQPLPG
jgi:hypothetical protein